MREKGVTSLGHRSTYEERIMKRLLVISAGIIAAGGIAVAPAVAGLSDNPSFSHQIPVRAPSQVTAPQLVDDHGTDLAPSPTALGRAG
jgi:hypothetical protein